MLNRLLQWFGKKNQPASSSYDALKVLLDKLARTETHELACDDVHTVLAEFTEMQQRGENVSHLMPLVQQHLDLCPDCQEEYDALLLALDAEAQLLA